MGKISEIINLENNIKNAETVKNSNTQTSRLVLFQDVGLLLFMACIGAGAVITAVSGDLLLEENIILLAGIGIVSLLAAMRAQTAAVISTAFIVIIYSVYKLFMYFSQNAEIGAQSFFWPFLFIGAFMGMSMYVSGQSRFETVNEILNRQIEEFTIVDSLTMLENKRSLFSDLRDTMALASRRNEPFGLLIIKLRYSDEIENVLSTGEFNMIRKRIADICQNTFRIEDRLYSLDKYGTIGLIYYADEKGAPTIKKRILAALTDKSAFPEIRNRTIVLDFAVVYKQYSVDYEKDSIKFYNAVENEFTYEV